MTKTADEAILGAIRAIASKRNTGYILIAELRPVLELSNIDLDWLRGELKRLDEAGRICLSTVELMAKMPQEAAAWYARNASGIPCHEVCLSESEKAKDAAAPVMTPGEMLRAMSDGLQLLWLNQPRHRPLLQRAAQQSRTFRVRPAPMPPAQLLRSSCAAMPRPRLAKKWMAKISDFFDLNLFATFPLTQRTRP